MIRTGFKRPDRIDPKTGEVRFSTFKKPVKETLGAKRPEAGKPGQLRKTELKRGPIKRKNRRARVGDNPRYLAFIRKQPCVVGGLRCKRSVPHHAIEMGGEELAGMASTAPDSDTVPLCVKHHRQFHLTQGFCKGWTKEQRRVFQQDEIIRLNAIWREHEELDVWQEPARKAV